MARKKEMDKLSWEVHQALAAGMSYGKWKAMQTPVTIAPKKNLIKVETNICAYCGVEFACQDSRSKYCSARCRKLRNVDYMRGKYLEKVNATTDDP